jgi:hypothetical protein
MNDIERTVMEWVERYMEQIKPFTDRITQLETQVKYEQERNANNVRQWEEENEQLLDKNNRLWEGIKLLRRGLREEADAILEEVLRGKV